MKALFPGAAAAAFILLSSSSLYAQFYAPETDYHDIAQRSFPVEAARVLAWQRNSGAGGKIVEITYKIQTTPAHETVWTLQWLDAANKPLREKTVRYPEALLIEGPKYFREVFKQIAAEDWAPASAPSENCAAAFWEGAAQAGLGRYDAIDAAGRLLKSKPAVGEAADAARLSGILCHGVLPILGDQRTIDSVLLARAAAWLCTAEGMLSAPLDEAWSPVLFLSSREWAAQALWKTLPQKPVAKLTAPERGWSLLLQMPSAHDAFAFAGHPGNQQFAMPLFAYFGRQDDLFVNAATDVIREIFEGDALEHLYDYAPTLAEDGNIGSGRLVEGLWPLLARRAWIKSLREFQPTPLDFSGYRDAAMAYPLATETEDETDQSLTGLTEAAKLINLGYIEGGAHPLIPVAAVTARDLLNHGWEDQCMQLRVRYHFVNSRWGVYDVGREIGTRALSLLDGIDPFIKVKEMKARRPIDDLSRVQYLAREFITVPLSKLEPKAWAADAAKGTIYMRRCWLWKGATCCQFEALQRANPTPAEAAQLLERNFAEGGVAVNTRLIHAMDFNLRAKLKSQMPKLNGLREKVVAATPGVVSTRADAIWREAVRKNSPEGWFEYATKAEKLAWENGIPIHYNTIFSAYIEANALDSAHRYYDQMHDLGPDPVGLSNTAGPRRWTLAWIEGDRAAMDRALKDSASYSARDLVLQCCDAIAREEYGEARQVLDACTERYGANRTNDSLAAFLPLVPALKDPKHPNHEKALDYFQDNKEWPTVQWIFIQTCKLSDDDAARFLGGDKALPERAMMIAFLKNDRAKFQENYLKIGSDHYGNMGWVLAHWMRSTLMQVAPPKQQPDLRPPTAQPLVATVLEEVRKDEIAQVQKSFDPASFKTADEMWAQIEKLKDPPGKRPASPAEALKVFREWAQRQQFASDAFAKAWPKDARRWDAKMMSLEARTRLAQIERKPLGESVESELKAVLEAPDAKPSAKGEAAYYQLMRTAGTVQPNAPHTFPPFHRQAGEFLEDYPSHPHAEEVATMQIQLLQMHEQPGAENILKKLSTHSNSHVADLAKKAVAARERVATLRKKPLELKLKLTDGREIDLAKLRGKVVLIDFWASWNGPSTAGLSELVKAYSALHDKGLEIVGISLDQNRESMDEALKSSGATWPQSFDGKAWQTPVAQEFGIRALPAAWLFDKKGLLRETDISAEEMAPAVEKLLRE